MTFENPTPAEGINVSPEHPLKEFAQLVVGLTVVSLLAIWLLSTLAGWLARQIPFDYEQSLVQDMEFVDFELNSDDKATRQRLQTLANRLAQHMELPGGMTIKVHYANDPTVNALATLGGNVVFFKGLVDELESEQALAAVMAHEIAHVKLRHPIVAAGKGLTVATLAAFISGASGSSASDWLLGNSMQLSLMSYSRQQESAADALAAEALQAEYGNIDGAIEVFKLFAEIESDSVINSNVPQLYRSHPYSDDRALRLEALAEKNGWLINGKCSSAVACN